MFGSSAWRRLRRYPLVGRHASSMHILIAQFAHIATSTKSINEIYVLVLVLVLVLALVLVLEL